MTTSEQALVFDIKRFAVHDGSGIRTTVFFKGCPLRCRWCHNPEGLERSVRPMFLKNRCIHCGSCEKAKETDQLTFENGMPVLNFRYAGSWDRVIRACPAGAIVSDSRWYSSDELLEKIRDDRVFFRETGGVTFSGGEPLLWARFLKSVMEACRKEGIRTAIETSLSIPQENLATVLPYCDEVYADLKIFDCADHMKYTGMGNEGILENMRFLLTSEKKEVTVIRTPLIPGITAVNENIAAIAKYIGSICPGVGYELLGCNTLAGAKYEMSGKEFSLEGKLRRFTEEEMNAFCKVAEDSGEITLSGPSHPLRHMRNSVT